MHVIYDRKVMDLPWAAGVDSPVQFVFDRTAISGLTVPGQQYLAISLSAGDEYVDTPVSQLRAQFCAALADLLPRARSAEVVDFFVTRERHATFRGVPGTGALRPQAATGLPGLVLAGAWTATGWPDTMEGAVRSGLAAAIALRADGRGAGRRGAGRHGAGRHGPSEPTWAAAGGTGPARGPAEPADSSNPSGPLGPFSPEPNDSASTMGVRP